MNWLGVTFPVTVTEDEIRPLMGTPDAAGELVMKKVEEAEVRVETPAGNFVGKIDFATAKKLQDRLGYGCEVWWKEVNP